MTLLTRAMLCVQAAKANNAPQLVLTYYDAWSTGCLSNNNFTDACALATFERDVLPQWSEDALAAAETTRAVRRPRSCTIGDPVQHSACTDCSATSPLQGVYRGLPGFHP